VIRAPFRLSAKLLLAIVPAVVAVVGLTSWLGYQAARRVILAAIDKEVALVAQRTAGNIDALLDQRYRDLFTLSETPLIADYYRNVDFGLKDEAEAYRKELQRYLGGFAARTRVYGAIVYLDAAGREVARAGAAPAPGAAFLAGLRTLPKGGWLHSPAVAQPGGALAVYYAKALRDETGELKGSLVLSYDLAEVKALLQGIVVGGHGRAYVLAPGGLRVEGRPAPEGPSDVLRASSPAGRMPWTVYVEAPQDDFLGPLGTVKKAVLAACGLGLAVLAALLLLLVRTVTDPLAALADAARRVGAGDLSARVPDPRQDEVGELGAAFNQMAGRLEEDRRQKAELQAQLIQAEKLSAIGQLISSVAHELNNPLSAISGYAQLAQIEDCPPRLREDLKHVYENVLRCRKVVDNLLFFARQSRQERKPVALNDAAASALELLKYRLRKSEDVDVRAELAPDSPVARADFQQVVQILVNLIGNACDAMEGVVRYPEPKRLTLRTGAMDGKAWIEVSDNGPGVPAAQRPRMFQAFFTTKPAGRGTGLGLSICRQIAEEHGGALSFESEEGRGATFRLLLPAAGPADHEPPAPVEEPSAHPAVPGKSVLVVDDEKDIVELIARVLREDGDEAVAVTDPLEALKLVRARSFDLVVSDMGMEGVRGPDLYAALAARMAPRLPRILFVTGDILNARVLEFFSKTRAEYLVKPFDVPELRQTLRRLLAG
jgi:signal transduction histidine kinase